MGFSTYLVTGGAGFIGSNYVLSLLKQPGLQVVNLDALTYAGNLDGLPPHGFEGRYLFERVDIRNAEAVRRCVEKHRPDCIVHFAAESHVDRSIHGPRAFVETNVIGTLNLLEAARTGVTEGYLQRFHHVSTDEVYGSLGPDGKFEETTAYDPSSPYSASKAGSDHLVRAYHRTYGLPVTVTNCSNNYGPRQFPEKLIPLMTLNALERKPLPVYGKGDNVRDWLHVADHNRAIQAVIDGGKVGETYNIGGDSERNNLQVIAAVLDAVAELTGADREELEGLITFVADRPGHDWRYAIDATKLQRELGWFPEHRFEDGIRQTVNWYLENQDWIARVRSGEYRQWMEQNYSARGAQ